MIKINWGQGIAIFYVLFASVLITALVASRGVDHSLVVDDYYAQDLAYQNQYNKTTNTIRENKVKVQYDRQAAKLTLDFKEAQHIKGEVQFYRPSDKSLDFTRQIDHHLMNISTHELVGGKWKVKVDWTEGDQAYYWEETVYL